MLYLFRLPLQLFHHWLLRCCCSLLRLHSSPVFFLLVGARRYNRTFLRRWPSSRTTITSTERHGRRRQAHCGHRRRGKCSVRAAGWILPRATSCVARSSVRRPPKRRLVLRGAPLKRLPPHSLFPCHPRPPIRPTKKHSNYLQDTVTGFLLAGVGHRTANSSNFLVVKPDTALPVIEASFQNLTNRDDIGIVLINQHVSVCTYMLLRRRRVPSLLSHVGTFQSASFYSPPHRLFSPPSAGRERDQAPP